MKPPSVMSRAHFVTSSRKSRGSLNCTSTVKHAFSRVNGMQLIIKSEPPLMSGDAKQWSRFMDHAALSRTPFCAREIMKFFPFFERLNETHFGAMKRKRCINLSRGRGNSLGTQNPIHCTFFFYETLAIPAFSFYSKINFCKSSLALFHGHILCTARAALSRSHNKLGIDKCIEIYIFEAWKRNQNEGERKAK